MSCIVFVLFGFQFINGMVDIAVALFSWLAFSVIIHIFPAITYGFVTNRFPTDQLESAH